MRKQQKPLPPPEPEDSLEFKDEVLDLRRYDEVRLIPNAQGVTEAWLSGGGQPITQVAIANTEEGRELEALFIEKKGRVN